MRTGSTDNQYLQKDCVDCLDHASVGSHPTEIIPQDGEKIGEHRIDGLTVDYYPQHGGYFVTIPHE
jgi:hypothetical protein